MFRITTIKGRLLWYNFCVICVVGVILSVSSYVTASKKAVEVATNSLRYHTESISWRYQMAYDELVNIILNCTDRGSFDLKQVGMMRTAAQKKTGIGYASLAESYCAVTGYGGYIRRLSLFSDQGSMVQAGSSIGSVDDWVRILDAEWFDHEKEKTMDHYQLELYPPLFHGEKDKTIPIVHPISGTGGHQWAALFLSPRLFQDELEKNDNGNAIAVFTSDGERVASLHETELTAEENSRMAAELLAWEETEGIEAWRVGGSDVRLAWQRDVKSGILVMELLDLETLKNDRLMLLQTVCLIFIACLAIGFILSYLFGSQVQRPINRLVSHINKIAGGDFTQAPELETGDEIGTVGKVVNSMAGQIDRLMNERLEDEKEKSSLELKMLQAQINPHFLYNTLDSIKWIAVIQKNSGIVKAVTALSGLLKNMAKGFHEKVTLEKELQFVSDYVTIEKLKYVEMFDLQL